MTKVCADCVSGAIDEGTPEGEVRNDTNLCPLFLNSAHTVPQGIVHHGPVDCDSPCSNGVWVNIARMACG
jgi:hypothetical protein